jgi:hypothetical protein
MVSISSINDYLVTTRVFFEYQNNNLLRRAVEREIKIEELSLKT